MPRTVTNQTTRRYESDIGFALARASAAMLAFAAVLMLLPANAQTRRDPVVLGILAFLVLLILAGVLAKRDTFVDATGGFVAERFRFLLYESTRTTGLDEIDAVVIHFRNYGSGGHDPNPRVAMRLKNRTATRGLIPVGAYKGKPEAQVAAEDLGRFIDRPVVLPDGF